MARAADIIATARTALGKPYVWGAQGPNSFDCSGLVQWAYGKHGVKLPRVAADQAKAGTRIPYGQHRPGDLIFSTWDSNPDVDHVAIYIGDGQYIHAPRAGRNVEIGKITDSYRTHITNIQRPTGVDGSGPATSLPGGIGGIIGGAIGLNPMHDALHSIAGGVRTMADAATNVGTFAATLSKLALPTTQVRIAAGIFGVACVAFGVFFVAREAL